MAILDELEQRGLTADVTNRDELAKLLAHGRISLYAGYDPTSTTLHIGNLVPTILLKRFQLAGHRPIVVVGGATGMIGDPSGQSAERNLLDDATLATNLAGIRGQLSRLLDFEHPETGAIIVNNADWTRGISYLEFLRDIGKFLTINYMMAKDSVKSRINRGATDAPDAPESGTEGISYTEFSYMLLQAFDFVHLARTECCRLQVGGSDQFGNITAGCELSRKMGGQQLFGLVAPLLLDPTGKKMGKTSTGEKVVLDPTQFSPYKFYQYWLNRDDEQAPCFLRQFSLRPLDEIEELLRTHENDRSKRLAQRELARAMTAWVHGDAAVASAEVAGKVMFGEALANLTDADLRPLADIVPTIEVPRAELEGGITIVDLVARAFSESKSNARRVVEQGGASLNNVAIRLPALDDLRGQLAELTKQLKAAGDAEKPALAAAEQALQQQKKALENELLGRRVTLVDLATETMLVVSSGKSKRALVRVI